MITAGTWVGITKVILEPSERADGIPQDTAAVPLKMWVSGFLDSDAQLGAEATITTLAGRKESGIIETVNPTTTVSYGEFVPEIQRVMMQL